MAARQGCQAAGALPLHQGLQGFFEQMRALERTAELLGLREQLIIEINGRAHRPHSSQGIILGII
jgi:hypothetical protein